MCIDVPKVVTETLSKKKARDIGEFFYKKLLCCLYINI